MHREAAGQATPLSWDGPEPGSTGSSRQVRPFHASLSCPLTAVIGREPFRPPTARQFLLDTHETATRLYDSLGEGTATGGSHAWPFQIWLNVGASNARPEPRKDPRPCRTTGRRTRRHPASA